MIDISKTRQCDSELQTPAKPENLATMASRALGSDPWSGL